MEQPSDSSKQQCEEAAQRELEMKERRRRQNRIAQRNHRKRKYSQNENNSCRNHIKEANLQSHTCPARRDTHQNPENCWLDSPSFVASDQVVIQNTLESANATSFRENPDAYLSPPGSLSPQVSFSSPEYPHTAKDNCTIAVAPTKKPFDSDSSKGPSMATDLEPFGESVQLLNLLTSGFGCSPLLSGAGFDTIHNHSQLYETNPPLQPSFGPSRHIVRMPIPEEHFDSMKESSIENAEIFSPCGQVRACSDYVDSTQRPDSSLKALSHEEPESKLDGKIALHLSAERGHTGIVKCLIEYGSDISIQDKSGATALHYAAKMGNMEVLTVLLDNGADGSVKDFQGRTPLHMAAEGGHEDAVRLLVEAGVDVNIQSQTI